MTTDREDISIFQAPVLAQKDVDGLFITLYANRILHYRIERFKKISLDIVQHGYKFIEENGGGKFYNIYEFDSFSDVEPEVREWASDSEGNLNTHTDAIVIGSLPQKIIADFYLRTNQPVSPTKIFNSLEKAVQWTLKMMND